MFLLWDRQKGYYFTHSNGETKQDTVSKKVIALFITITEHGKIPYEIGL